MARATYKIGAAIQNLLFSTSGEIIDRFRDYKMVFRLCDRKCFLNAINYECSEECGDHAGFRQNGDTN